MRPTPKLKKIRILKRLFSGETYPSAAMNENSSTSTIKKIFDEFADYAASSSLEEAAENYGVQEEIEILREIACDARKAGSSFPELLAGARLSLLLKKLGLSPVHLEDIIKALDKYKDKFGDFIQSALRLASLEEETGKTYNDIIGEYENTKNNISKLSEEMDQTRAEFSEEKKAARKKIRSLYNKIHSLDEKIQTRESQLIQLDKRAQKAQTVLDEFERTKNELQSYGIEYGDFTTVKNFLDNIHKLKGNAAKAVRMIEESDSLENKLSLLKTEIEKNERRIEELKTTKRELEDRIGEDENRIGILRNEKIALMEKITELTKKRQALELQVDGLQKMLAERLGVQPDIDVIYETIPIRKKELQDLEERINAKRSVLSIAVAFESVLQRFPADRKVLIRWLESGGVSQKFQASDEMARQKIIELLAKEDFVPKSKLDETIKAMQDKIDKAEEGTRFWSKRAKTKSEKLIECEKLLQQAHATIDKQKNEELDKKIASFIVSLSSHI